jgi:hypothetical protein
MAIQTMVPITEIMLSVRIEIFIFYFDYRISIHLTTDNNLVIR